MQDELLTTEEAAAFLRVSPRTLEDWRYKSSDEKKVGPDWFAPSHRVVRYTREVLDAFLQSGYLVRRKLKMRKKNDPLPGQEAFGFSHGALQSSDIIRVRKSSTHLEVIFADGRSMAIKPGHPLYGQALGMIGKNRSSR
jgi:hypothetical protein